VTDVPVVERPPMAGSRVLLSANLRS
jgi:hypothetical protein